MILLLVIYCLFVENNELRNNVECLTNAPAKKQIVIGVKKLIIRCGSVKGSLSSKKLLGTFTRRIKVLLSTKTPLS
jgi:hypothetical protein